MLVLQDLHSAYLRLLFVVVHPRSLIAGHPTDMYEYFGQAPSMQTSGSHSYHEHDDSDSECSWEGSRVVEAMARHFHIAGSYHGFLASSVAHIQRRVSHLRSEAAAVQVR